MRTKGEPLASRRSAYARPIIGGLLAATAAGSLTLWLVRKPIATALIDRRLAEAHVTARYRIADLGLGRQRLTDVMIGDPAHPDLRADWIELATHIGLSGPQVSAVRAGGLRVAAALVDGKLSLGSLDRLLPATTGGGPFRLPAIDLETEDSRLRLATAAGALDLTVSGKGRLDDGFDGLITVASARLAPAGCLFDGITAAARVSVRHGEPTWQGPLRAERFRCGLTKGRDVRADAAATLGGDFKSWRGSVRAAAGAVAAQGLLLADLAGTLDFRGSAAETRGTATLASGAAALGRTARADRLALAGRYGIGHALRFAGQATMAGASLSRPLLAQIADQGRMAAGTPVGPLLAQAADALAVAGRSFSAAAELMLEGKRLSVPRMQARAATGAALALSGGRGLSLSLAAPTPSVDGVITLAGGGLPTATVRLSQADADAPVQGEARIAPYTARGASLTLTPVWFTADRDGVTRLDTVATLTGPLPGGHVEGLSLPIAARRSVTGDLAIDPGCTTARFERLALSSLRLDAAVLPLCATGAALVRIGGGRFDAGGRLAPVRLAGRLGGTPLVLTARGGTAEWRQRGFALSAVTARLGTAEAATTLALGRLTGTLADGGVQGRFADAGGRIGTVPLQLSEAEGAWRMRGGVLTLNGTLMVADTAADPRFKPLRGEQVALTLANNRITAQGRLVSPAKGETVATVAITHDLAAASGSADLTVPGLAFDKDFQPDDLTRLTFGVIADVRGTIDGRARIAWGREGVSSTGSFHTDGTDLAAAFGPVAGLAGTIRFTDLLSLTSAPDQSVTIASINPGIAVTDGRVTFQTLPDAHVKVTSGHWPFAGGSLRLEPTLLDFTTPTRQMTFTLSGVDAGLFLQQFDFDNISATGTFDGTLPIAFDEEGGRIENGHLQVSRGGGNLAYLGELTQKDLGTWGNLAFQALRSIDYRNLSITMNGPLAGEMITEVRFAGISQGKGAKSNFLIRRLQKLPFVFNIRIRAPFRGLIDSAQSFYDPSRLIVRNLPMLLQQQGLYSSQPPESENVP